MSDFVASHASEIWSAVVAFLTGGAAGSLITFKVVRSQQATSGGRNVDQSRSSSKGDIVGGNKTTSYGKK